MKQLSSFMALNVNGGDRISFTYDTIDENIVVEEFQKGYTYRESVIRHSMVKVAN